MKAITMETYGPPDVLRLRDMETAEPQADEVLVKIHAASLNAADRYTLAGKPVVVRFFSGLSKPKSPRFGSDFAGTIVKTGSNVTQFKVGQAVIGDLSGSGLGALAEYAVAPAKILAHKPEALTFEEAAALPMASVTALQGLRTHGKLKAGQNVLIHGASGGVGTFAVQIAKALGANVTAVCSTRNVEQAYALGADRVIDYKTEDFAALPERYDLILGINGDRSLRDYKQVLTAEGVYLAIGGSLKQIMQGLLLGPLFSLFGKQRFGGFMAHPNADDLAFVAKLAEAGQLKPVISRVFPLEQTRRAMEAAGSGRSPGKIVISIA